jgi:hypothetical protein
VYVYHYSVAWCTGESFTREVIYFVIGIWLLIWTRTFFVNTGVVTPLTLLLRVDLPSSPSMAAITNSPHGRMFRLLVYYYTRSIILNTHSPDRAFLKMIF